MSPRTATRLATPAWIALVLLVAASSLFGVLDNGFVWDDGPFIVWNETLRGPGTLQRVVTEGDSFGTRGDNPYYRPVTTLSFAMDVRLFGENAAGYHATNLLLHLAVCALVFGAALQCSGRRSAAGAAALLFAVHPAVVEPVAYVSARADLLCAAFMLGAWLLYTRGRRSGSPRDLGLAALVFALALFAKIVALALLPVLALHELLRCRREERRLRPIAPFAALAGLFLLARALVLERATWEHGEPFVSRLATAGPLLVKYLRNTLLPFGLKVYYDEPVRTTWTDPAVVAAWAVVGGCAAAWWLLLRRRPAAAIGLAWFFAALLPVCGAVDLLYPALMADRYLYVPLAGAALALAGSIPAPGAWERGPAVARGRVLSRAGGAVVVACVLAFSVTSAHRVSAWRDPVTLWERARRQAPTAPYVLNQLGASYWQANRLKEAKRVLTKAAALAPGLASPIVNLAAVAFLQGDTAAAERYTEQALRLSPGHSVGLRYRGILHAARGRRELAVASLRAALAADPFDAPSRLLLSELEGTPANEL